MFERSILIVDDEESLRLTFEMFLKREGYTRVRTAATLEEALEAINETTFDLIISDIVLGSDKGTELLRHIRETGITCPVVMITGFPNLETASEAVRLGAFDYISKPVKKDTLLRLVRQALKYWELELQKEELVRRNEKYQHYLEAIFSSVRDAIIAVDSDLNIMKANQTAKRWLQGFNLELTDNLSQIPGELGAACSKDASRVINDGQIVREHLVETREPDGSMQMISLNAAPLESSDETYNGAVLVARNITISKQDSKSNDSNSFHGFIGSSKVMQGIYRLIENVGQVDTSVLISGESGTGKELAAEALHAESLRSSMPLIKVDCASLPEDLLESELFGHRKGSFTGADRDRPGRLLQADKGTLLLDEIGDITPRMQLRLLRFLQEMTFTPVGMDTPLKVDVRVIAATNVNLKEHVRQGLFREDLYYRIKVVEVHLPPLRERKECLPLLINHFLTFYCEKHDRSINRVSDLATEALLHYSWPGNVRELRHIIERACVLCKGSDLLLEHLPEEIANRSIIETETRHERAFASEEKRGELSLSEMKQAEKDVLIDALRKASGNKSKAAQLLSIDRSTLYRRMKRFNISIKDL